MLKKRAQYRIGIDMGERHLFAIVCDRPETAPVLVPNTLTAGTMRGFAAEGGHGEAVLASVRRHVHARCSYLIGLCAEWGVKSIAVGNRAIKNPFKVTYGSLTGNPLLNLDIQILSTLRFECALSHIDVEIVDEAFTTQKDALALEKLRPVPYGREKQSRGSTGLHGRTYRSRNGETLDRDINAAINIGRLVFGDDFARPIIRSRLWKKPVRAAFPEEDRAAAPCLLARRSNWTGTNLLFPRSAVLEMAPASLSIN